MRGLIALCVGLVLGATDTVNAQISADDCCQCACTNIGVILCVQEGMIPCGILCNQRGEEADPDATLCFPDTQCSAAPSCPQSEKRAPVAGPLGIAALLIALGGFGAWRLRNRAA